MGDQQRWFKLWTTAPGDDGLQALPPAYRWAWAALGAHTKAHGTHGRVSISPTNAVLAAEMGVPLDDLLTVILTLPHVVVSQAENRHGEFTVTFLNWIKFQEDSTQAKRALASRSKKRRESSTRTRSTRTTSFKNASHSFPELATRGTHGSNGASASDPASELLDFLNRKSGHGYRPVKTTLDMIRARLASGASADQVRWVIAAKCREWRDDPDRAKYLRPETLFRASKFESYLGQLPSLEPHEEV